jgi:hypothetical protein
MCNRSHEIESSIIYNKILMHRCNTYDDMNDSTLMNPWVSECSVRRSEVGFGLSHSLSVYIRYRCCDKDLGQSARRISLCKESLSETSCTLSTFGLINPGNYLFLKGKAIYILGLRGPLAGPVQ